MRRGIFREILILYLLMTVVSVLALGIFLDGVIGNYYLSELRSNLAVEAELTGSQLREIPRDKITDVVNNARAITGARVTIIQGDGVVLADSHSDHREMENHGQRPEVREAFTSDTGSAARRSSTVGSNLYYVAERIDMDSGPLVVRLAVPLRDVESTISRLKYRILLAVALVFLAGGVFAALQIRRIKHVAGKIARFSGSVAAGNFEAQLHFRGYEEFDQIAEDLNTMASELSGMLARLKDEASRLNIILEGIPDALLISDASGRIVLSSEASRTFFERSDINGSAIEDIVHGRKFHELLETVKTRRGPVAEDIPAGMAQERYWSVRISPFFEGDAVGGYISIFNDITQLVKIDQVRKDFVANASHEIKTPITAIRGFAETLLDGALDDRGNATRFLEIIRAHSERINRLVDDLMTISKIELGVVPLEKQDVDLEEIVENVVLSLEEKARTKGLAIHSWLRQETPRIHADRHRLFQILANLVDNAIKFTETGNITVGTGEEAGRWYVYVKDTGIGIPESLLPRIGERFYRVDPSRSRELGGTGLGLAIVKHLVRAHGWDWNIDSKPGQGTRVRIFLQDTTA